MARFDVVRLKSSGQLVIDVQNDYLDGINSRVVVPLSVKGLDVLKEKRLYPVLAIQGTDHVMVTHQLTAVSNADFEKVVENLARERDRITAALDFVFQGF